MKICYTVCSLNRLGQILVLSKSFLKHNPDYKFFACLVDEINDRIDVKQFPFINFIPFSYLELSNKQALSDKYDLFELSCAGKAFFGKYLLAKFEPELLIYLDTDIVVYDRFTPIEQELEYKSILLTPHFSMPVPGDGKVPLERSVLNSGLYNGGFLALRNDDVSKEFFAWWQERLFDQGFNNVCDGMMVDQLWLNLVPIYFHSSTLLYHPGCNLAYWNLHERTLKFQNGKVTVDNEPLIFFHFSGYRIDQPKRLSVHQNRIREAEHPGLCEIIENYFELLTENGFDKFLLLQPFYGRKRKKRKDSALKRGMINLLARFGYSLERIKRIT